MKGEVVYLHAFDVGDEIVLRDLGVLLGQRPHPYEILTDRTHPKDVPFYKPLAVEQPLPAPVGGQPGRALVRVYEVGAVTVALCVPFEVASVQELMPRHHPQMDNGLCLHQYARELLVQVVRELGSALVRPTAGTEPEAYTVFCITDLPSVPDVNRWLEQERRAVAGLLAETPADQLSEAQVSEILRYQRSFERTDLVVIDWDAALLVELSGYADDTLYVLELANLQLEEFRAIDRTLDRYLDQAYADLGRRRATLFGSDSRTLRKLRWHRIDVTKLADEVSHITKLLGDWHLARVYIAAAERFYLDQWRRSVERRLGQLDELYTVLHGEVNEQRMLWLEFAIVVLFILDLLVIFLK